MFSSKVEFIKKSIVKNRVILRDFYRKKNSLKDLFRKKKITLLKKIYKLDKLCDANIAIIIY